MLEPRYKRFFSTLSSRTRLEIIFALRERSMNVSELEKRLRYHQSTISNNLRILSDCGFVEKKPNGKERIYSLNTDTIEPLLELVDRHTETCCKPFVEEST